MVFIEIKDIDTEDEVLANSLANSTVCFGGGNGGGGGSVCSDDTGPDTSSCGGASCGTGGDGYCGPACGGIRAKPKTDK